MCIRDSLKNKHGLSLIVLAHTPKRDLRKEITRNDLQGSKMLINFCDASFAIGESALDSSLKYLKQIKVRNTGFTYDSENVVVCQISKPHTFLGFEVFDYQPEATHLKVPTEKEQTELKENIIALKKAEPHLSLHKIAKRLDTNAMKVKRVLERNQK